MGGLTPLVKQYPEPRSEMHPRLAATLGIKDERWTTAETRRGSITLRAMVVSTIRPCTIFIPYFWLSRKSPNQLTDAARIGSAGFRNGRSRPPRAPRTC